MNRAIRVTEYEAVSKTLFRLDDSDGTVFTRAEVKRYLRDGYDRLCRRTKVLFDMAYIENLPSVGNYSSDEEFELAKQIPGLILTGKRQFTREIDRDFSQPGTVGPSQVSAYVEIPLLNDVGSPTPNPVGRLPREFVEIQQVIHDRIVLNPEFSRGMAREIDNRYEIQTGDPDWYTVDKDGLFSLRRYPGGDGAAAYSEVQGWFGGETSDSDYTGVVVGSWGTMTFDPEHFPIGGPWGAPTRTHPEDNNTRVELTRLGRDLEEFGFEIPSNYVKYVVFWACHRALKRDGPGQDLKLSDHYEDRFEMGVTRLIARMRDVLAEHAGRIGHGPQTGSMPSLTVHLPYNYGRRIKRHGGY